MNEVHFLQWLSTNWQGPEGGVPIHIIRGGVYNEKE